jgi:hypothetical protein
LCSRSAAAAEGLEPLVITITQAPLPQSASVVVCGRCLIGDLTGEELGRAILERLDGERRAARLLTLFDAALGFGQR